MKQQFEWPLLLLIVYLTLVLVPLCLAQECLSPSPTTLSGKKSYEPIEDRDLTPDEFKTLEALFKSLDGEWQGTADTFFCRSISDPNDVLPEHFTVKAKVSVDSYGNLLLTAEFYDPADRSNHQQTLRLYLNNNRLRIDHDTGAGDVELITVNDHTIAFLYRRVNPTGNRGGSSRSEYFFTLLSGERSLTIDQQIYVQAKLSSGYSWQLRR
jgi:hypothetical protein